ncbi:MAG: right-handed parallel beta-helix repeat-containing protein [Candidatus Eisenbacteria sp.]|nr:right-handed parallel beta-helix repeat-containing protein [Candidatus Eisenbacteria bacterium]
MRSASQSMLVLVLVTLVLVVSYVGSASAEVIEIEGATGEPGIRLQSQGVAGVEIRHEVHSFAFEPLEIDGETMQKICLPNVFLPNNAGAPDLPGESRLVGLPEGATATLEIVSSRTLVYHNVEVAPAPVIPLQNDDSPLVYQKDLAIYTRNALYPSSPALISEPHQMRGVDVVAVGITPFQYNPVTKELIVYTELEVRVAFHGGNGLFGEDRLRNRYWEPILESHLINYASLPKMDFGSLSDSREGYEYVIITPDNPDFIAWGDTLKAWRKLQGISTEVFTTSDIGGTSAAEIEAWLDNAYNSWDIPPVAFMILGDYPESGDRDIGITSPIYNSTCVSDNIYADVDGDHLPEMAHGRITARGAAELETMIIKMLSYEREPYTDPDFYDHPIMAGGWQTDRWFILCTEIVFGFQTNILGKDPVREYAIFTGTPGTVWSTSANTDILVDYFGPNGLGYIPATPEHLTDWGGNAERLNTDINSGAYMLLHRDHGWMDGWGEPDYHIPDLAGLSNDLFPFVFSINCLTGMYNWESECFTEAFHRMVHGALGVIAASETSYSFVNDTFIWGMFDELWPEFMPDYPLAGSDNMGSTNLRTAWGMISGKWFLFGSEWPWNTGNKEVTYHLFHHHGDAFLTMYSEVPQELDVFHYDSCPLNTDMFAFQANAGAVVALTVDGEIIGVADATGAPQTMSIIPQTQPGTLRITVTNANYFRYDETIPIGGTAYLVKPDGTGDFATIQAAIDAVAEGVTIELADGTYTGEGNRDVDFIGKAVTVRSRYGNPEACIIDAEGLVADPHRGFQFVSGEGSGTLLAGVKILGGVYENGEGAGILCHGSSPRIEHCAITGNLASNGLGGGLACMAGASPSVVACTFEANEGNLGGGIYCASGSPALEGCTFKANIAADGGGGAHFTGNGSLPTLDSSTFWSNEALTGGGVACTDSAAVTVTHCTFYDDFAYEGAAVSVGTDASAILENNIVAFGREGAGIACDGSGASASLTCCDLYNNAGGDWVGCIADQYGINGNMSLDPMFCGEAILDDPYTLRANSPCVPYHNPECGLIGARPRGCGFSETDGEPAYMPTVPCIVQLGPSPCTHSTCLRYSVPGKAENIEACVRVRLRILDVSGRAVKSIFDADQRPGTYSVYRDGGNHRGQCLGSGIYLWQLTMGERSVTKRVVLVR